MTDPDAPTLIFLHVGKTGGSTLQRILYRNYPPDVRAHVLLRGPHIPRPPREESLAWFAALPEHHRARVRVIEGHLIYGIHRAIPRPSEYVTLLRDPVALTVSHYRYIVRTPTHPLHDRVVELGSLDAYVRSGISLETDNSQVRAIAGDRTTPFGGCGDALLSKAISHVEHAFPIVGVVERFDESLVLMQERYGWRRVAYAPVNRAPRSQLHEPVAPSTVAYIAELNRLDRRLHAWATRRLDSMVLDGERMRDAMAHLRIVNSVYRPWMWLTYSSPRALRDVVRGTT